MAIIRMTAQKAREYVKNNDAKLQLMYDTAPFADEVSDLDAKSAVRGFAAFNTVKKSLQCERMEYVINALSSCELTMEDITEAVEEVRQERYEKGIF
jgi:uncharacterized protein Smg (DUF494 family)